MSWWSCGGSASGRRVKECDQPAASNWGKEERQRRAINSAILSEPNVKWTREGSLHKCKRTMWGMTKSWPDGYQCSEKEMWGICVWYAPCMHSPCVVALVLMPHFLIIFKNSILVSNCYIWCFIVFFSCFKMYHNVSLCIEMSKMTHKTLHDTTKQSKFCHR